MSVHAGPNAVESGLVLALDAANPKSYPGTGTTWFDLTGKNNGVASLSISTTSETPGTVVRLDNTNTIQVNFVEPINKYQFTFSYWGRGTAVPSGNYRRIWTLIEPNAPHGYYFIGDTREVATPYILHYVKDYSTNNWDTRNMIVQSEFLNFQWNYFTLVMLAENNWRSYRNGVLLGTNSTPSQNLSPYGNITRLNIGGTDTKFNISNITMYNRVLTDNEIQQNFNAYRGRFGI